MANTTDLFKKFIGDIKILSNKKDRMIKSKNALRDKIRKYFKENHTEYKPLFYIQGSHKTKNGIRYKDDTADLDDGVYFDRVPDVTPATLQKWVLNAVKNHTNAGEQHKRKCIRVLFANDYHIDFPVFYKTEDMDHPKLAVKDEGWFDDDPKEFVEWFTDKKDKSNQLVEISMCLKAWCDNISHKMPSGLCMTILSEDNINYDDRIDIALKDTLNNIKASLDVNWACIMPTTPFEDLFLNYDSEFKRKFNLRLDSFLDDAIDAVSTDDKAKASKLWRKHLGDRFPLFEVKKSENALGNVAGSNRPWAS